MHTQKTFKNTYKIILFNGQKSFTSTTQSSSPLSSLIRETSHKKKTFKKYLEPKNKKESPESQRQWNEDGERNIRNKGNHCWVKSKDWKKKKKKIVWFKREKGFFFEVHARAKSEELSGKRGSHRNPQVRGKILLYDLPVVVSLSNPVQPFTAAIYRDRGGFASSSSPHECFSSEIGIDNLETEIFLDCSSLLIIKRKIPRKMRFLVHGEWNFHYRIKVEK